MVFGRGPRSSADKPVSGERRSRPNFYRQTGLGARPLPSIATHVFGRGPKSSADKPLFGTRRSRPNFCDRLALGRRQAHNFLIEVFGRLPRVSPAGAATMMLSCCTTM